MSLDWNRLSLEEMSGLLVDSPWTGQLIACARREDLSTAGDVTTLAMGHGAQTIRALLSSRSGGVLAGLGLLPVIARAYDPLISVRLIGADGRKVGAGEVVAEIGGPRGAVLAAERVLLNFLTHLSGIATLTARFVEQVAGTRARIYDTRKTLPGYRHLQKYAVRCGGGFCHRLGLHDAMLVKDNHLAHLPPDRWLESLAEAVATARRQHDLAFVEIEVDTLQQLEKVLTLDVDIVLLDNMTPDQMAQAVQIRNRLNSRVELEASGGIRLETAATIAGTGVDRLAVGALTHSAPSLDLGLDFA